MTHLSANEIDTVRKIQTNRQSYTMNKEWGNMKQVRSGQCMTYCHKVDHLSFDFLLPFFPRFLDLDSFPSLSPFTPSMLKKSLLFSSLPLIPAWDSVSLFLSVFSEFKSTMPLTACEQEIIWLLIAILLKFSNTYCH